MRPSDDNSLHLSSSLPFHLRDSVCERPTPRADSDRDAPDVGPFREGKKLCVRHEKMADEGVNAQLQSSLDALPLADRQAINAVWSTFSSSSHPRREIILKGLLTMCCFSQLSLLSEQVHHLIRLDPFDILPREISLKVLSHLDAFSLGKAAQVSSNWKSLADDDLLWRGMCVQHIERKCTKCGWGLPLLERRRLRMEIDGHYEDSAPSSPTLAASSHHHHHHEHPNAPHIKPSRVSQPIASTSTSSSHLPPSISTTPSSSAPSSPRRLAKRPSPPSDDENDSSTSSSSNKRTRSHSARPTPLSASHSLDYDAASSSSSSSSIQPPPPSSCALPPTNAEASCSSSKIIPFASTSRRPAASCRTLTRPWKEVYTERLIIERNWRRGRYAVRTFKGHTDGVMCLQVLEGEEFSSAVGSAACGNRKGKGREKASPGQGIMITGSYDRTARVWDLESGKEVMVMRGHQRGIRALQFDSAILITGSMDHTMKIWNWRTGACIRTLAGHSDGVVCLNYDKNVLASGSVDSTVKIWNFRNGDCFTLRGHKDWVNSVVLWDGITSPSSHWASSSSTPSSSCFSTDPSSSSPPSIPAIDPGKMLFSGSDDGSIRLWDLGKRECVMVFEGHVGQVQSMKLLYVDREKEDEDEVEAIDTSITPYLLPYPPTSLPNATANLTLHDHPHHLSLHPSSQRPISSVYDPPPGYSVPTSSSQQPTTRHPSEERMTSVAKSRKKVILVSASLDNTVKVWDVESGKVKKTMFGHIEGVWGVDADPLRVVSSSHDRTIKIWSREDAKCTQTLVGHRGAVTCLQLTDTQILSGSDDGEVRMWNFGASA